MVGGGRIGTGSVCGRVHVQAYARSQQCCCRSGCCIVTGTRAGRWDAFFLHAWYFDSYFMIYRLNFLLFSACAKYDQINHAVIHNLRTKALCGWEKLPSGLKCLYLDGPTVSHFIDTPWATVDPRGGVFKHGLEWGHELRVKKKNIQMSNPPT